MNVDEDGDAAGFELGRRNYEANALVIEPRSSLMVTRSPMMIHKENSTNHIVRVASFLDQNA